MICRKSDSDSVEKVVSVLKNGGVAVLPTDTVYGFSAIVGPSGERIRKIKGRSETKPFIQLVSSPDDVLKISDDSVPEKLLSFWPGPLTIIVSEKNQDSTVAVRCPGDEWLRKIISMLDCPIYSTSVNRSGSPVLSKESEIIDEFDKEVDLIVLDGDKIGSVPSTIVNVSNGKLEIVRKGAVDLTGLF